MTTLLEVTTTPVILTAPSALGYIAVAANDGAVAGVVFGHRSRDAASACLMRRVHVDGPQVTPQCDVAAAYDEADTLAADALDRLVRYADGEPVELDDLPVSVTHLTAFGRRVIKACRAIRRGERRSYREIATTAGRPGAARAVGQVMAGNRTPLVVPCHRVVAADGGLGGFSAPQGLAMKRRLLELESAGRLGI